MQYENRTQEYQHQVEECLLHRHPFVLFIDQENYVTVYPAEGFITPFEKRHGGRYQLPDIGIGDFEKAIRGCINKYPNFHGIIPVPSAPPESITIAVKNDLLQPTKEFSNDI